MQSYYIIFEKQKIWFHNSNFCAKKLEKCLNPPRIAVTRHVTVLQFRIPICVIRHIENLIFPDFIAFLCYFADVTTSQK